MATEQICIITATGVRKCYDIARMEAKYASPDKEPIDPEGAGIGVVVEIIRELLEESNYRKGEAAVIAILPTPDDGAATAN